MIEEAPARNELSVVSYIPPTAAATAKAAKPRNRSPKQAAPVAHPTKLAVQNGVLSFAEGGLKLLPSDATLVMRAGRLGSFDPVPYIPLPSLREEDLATDLHAFLSSLFPDADVREYVLGAVASCLDGICRVPNLFLCLGDGSNGKSAFQTLVSLTLGDYATAVSPEALCKKTSKDQFLKMAAHRRWLAVGEPDLSSSLNAGAVSTLLETVPAHVFLFTCELPRLKADDALWSKIRVLPFEGKFVDELETKPDRRLQEKLPLWRKAFLSLLVDRFYSATHQVRAEPSKVLRATALYRTKNDPFQQFLKDCFVRDEAAPPIDIRVLKSLARSWRLGPGPGPGPGNPDASSRNDLKDTEVLSRLFGVRGLRPNSAVPASTTLQLVLCD